MSANWQTRQAEQPIGEFYVSRYESPSPLVAETVHVIYGSILYQRLFQQDRNDHDCFVIMPDDAFRDLEARGSDWRDEPMARYIIFHRLVDYEWNEVRHIIEEELAIRGYTPLQEDD